MNACDGSASGMETAVMVVYTRRGPLELCAHHAEVNQYFIQDRGYICTGLEPNPSEEEFEVLSAQTEPVESRWPAPAAIFCYRCGGPWGEDETCENCTFEDGTARPYGCAVCGADWAVVDGVAYCRNGHRRMEEHGSWS
jgi:hypothetical protein